MLFVELWGILTAFGLAWELKFSKIWVEYDFQDVVGLVLKGCSHTHSYLPIVLAIKEFMSRTWAIRVTHVSHYGNRVAACLENHNHSMALGLHSLHFSSSRM